MTLLPVFGSGSEHSPGCYAGKEHPLIWVACPQHFPACETSSGDFPREMVFFKCEKLSLLDSFLVLLKVKLVV